MRQLITSGAVKRPQALLCAPSAAAGLLAAPPGVDVAALAQSAFSATPATAPQGALALRDVAGGALAPQRRAPPVYNRALGVDPAARPRQLGATQVVEASGVAVTATTFRDLTLPD